MSLWLSFPPDTGDTFQNVSRTAFTQRQHPIRHRPPGRRWDAATQPPVAAEADPSVSIPGLAPSCQSSAPGKEGAAVRVRDGGGSCCTWGAASWVFPFLPFQKARLDGWRGWGGIEGEPPPTGGQSRSWKQRTAGGGVSNHQGARACHTGRGLSKRPDDPGTLGPWGAPLAVRALLCRLRLLLGAV